MGSASQKSTLYPMHAKAIPNTPIFFAGTLQIVFMGSLQAGRIVRSAGWPFERIILLLPLDVWAGTGTNPMYPRRVPTEVIHPGVSLRFSILLRTSCSSPGEGKCLTLELPSPVPSAGWPFRRGRLLKFNFRCYISKLQRLRLAFVVVVVVQCRLNWGWMMEEEAGAAKVLTWFLFGIWNGWKNGFVRTFLAL